jgi:hypothetical protein
MQPPRVPWKHFPDVLIQADETSVKQHSAYATAKTGDAAAAMELVVSVFDEAQLPALREIADERQPILVSAHAYERGGVNAIPEVLADVLAARLGWPVDTGVVQTNIVSHTGADGFSRLARQAAFGGPITPGPDYVMVDDFIGMGGTLANLRGHVESSGGRVFGGDRVDGKAVVGAIAVDRRTSG